MTTNSDAPLTSAQVDQSVRLVNVAGYSISMKALKGLLPDIETALFFAKAYRMDYEDLSTLLWLLFQTDVIEALLGEAHVHSAELQDYIVDVVPEDVQTQYGTGHYDKSKASPDTDLLVQVFEQATVEVASSIQNVVDKLGLVLESFPSKYGEMTFSHLLKLNRQYNAIGTYEAEILHKRTPPRLVILDVSGSMSEDTVARIVEPVVALAYEINAHIAIVSNTATLWEPGTFGVDDILDAAEYGGTHYEKLAPIFDEDWETVVTIADYDSAASARDYLRRKCIGSVGQVLDISLVNQPTYLSECVGQLAKEVTPLLIGTGSYVLCN